jgi:hypothetical protein
MFHPKMLPAPVERSPLRVRWYNNKGMTARVGLAPLRRTSVLDLIFLAASRCGTERASQKVIAL